MLLAVNFVVFGFSRIFSIFESKFCFVSNSFKMVISLDNEISPYEPFGRSIIESIPNPNLTLRSTESSSEQLSDENFSFNNDFITSELDQCRDLFRSINEINNNDNDNGSAKLAKNKFQTVSFSWIFRIRY